MCRVYGEQIVSDGIVHETDVHDEGGQGRKSCNKELRRINCVLAVDCLAINHCRWFGCQISSAEDLCSPQTARQCNANQHCIRTVWEHQVLPPDNGEICDTCKKMVAEARDELKSNETQENLKLVLEGSCLILIPIKPLAHECVKLVDQAIPQLIEALSSQMDPQVVCSVAGLCNSRHIDRMLANYKLQTNAAKSLKLNCDNCEMVAGMAEKNFRSASRDQVLNAMLENALHSNKLHRRERTEYAQCQGQMLSFVNNTAVSVTLIFDCKQLQKIDQLIDNVFHIARVRYSSPK
ncbi:hypothetical protein J6590_051032 [Homalodisca vitripennis]|nr:hypothetical protein J6590_051032 [Homalodisca vitripennis]